MATWSSSVWCGSCSWSLSFPLGQESFAGEFVLINSARHMFWMRGCWVSIHLTHPKEKNCFATVLKLWKIFSSNGKPYIQNEDTERCRTQHMKNVEECEYSTAITHCRKWWLLPLVAALVHSEVLRPFRNCAPGWNLQWWAGSNVPAASQWHLAAVLHVSGTKHRQELELPEYPDSCDISSSCTRGWVANKVSLLALKYSSFFSQGAW